MATLPFEAQIPQLRARALEGDRIALEILLLATRNGELGRALELGHAAACRYHGEIVELRAVLSADGSAWEADHCDTCNGNWFIDPPLSPAEIPTASPKKPAELRKVVGSNG